MPRTLYRTGQSGDWPTTRQEAFLASRMGREYYGPDLGSRLSLVNHESRLDRDYEVPQTFEALEWFVQHHAKFQLRRGRWYARLEG